MLTIAENALPHAVPESQGIASAAILAFVEAAEREVHELHSFILVRHGRTVAEGWWQPYRRQDPHVLFSLSKSFTSTAIGLAISEGCLSLDDPVLSFFPDETPAHVSGHLAAMRVRHLLSMSTGHAEDTTPYFFKRSDGDWVSAFLDVPVTHAPGTFFLYNTGATFMLSAIVQKVTGLKLIDYLKPLLFEPLGIENPTWEESPRGINTGGFGLSITTGDIARFGQLYLQKGEWMGRQILPAAWVEQATAYQVSNADNQAVEWKQGYGYQFWRCRHNAYRGDGAFGQFCIVMPDQDAVLAITAGVGDMQRPLDLVWEHLLPAMHSDPLTADPAEHARLLTKLASLSISPVPGSAFSPLAARLSGHRFEAAPNDLAIRAFSVAFTDSGCTVTVGTARGEESFTAGFGVWQAGESALFNEHGSTVSMPIVASGAWSHDDCYTLVVRLWETPFVFTLIFRFADDQLVFESTVNVSFEPIQTRVVKALRT